MVLSKCSALQILYANSEHLTLISKWAALIPGSQCLKCAVNDMSKTSSCMLQWQKASYHNI